MLHHLFEQHVVSGSSAAVAPGVLAVVGEGIGDPTIPMKLLAGIGDVDSALPSHALWAMSRRIRDDAGLTAAFDAGIDGVLDRLASDDAASAAALLAEWETFIAEFGSRGPNEWDIHAESWETDPTLPLAALDRVRFQADEESPHVRHDAVAAQRVEVTTEVRAKVADNEELSGMLEAALVAANMMAYRERTKTTIVKVIHEARMAFRELGRRHAEAGDLDDADHVFMLLGSELDDFVADPASFRERLTGRAADYAALWEIEPPSSSATATCRHSAHGSVAPRPMRSRSPRPGRRSAACQVRRAWCGAQHGSCSTRMIQPPWNRATSSSRPTPTRRGRRCS